MKSALFLTAKLPCPPEDGGRIAAWNLARCLRHNGFELDLACFSSSPEAVAAEQASLDGVFRSVTTVTRDVTRQYPLELLRALVTGRSYFVNKYHLAELEQKLERLLEAGSYDLTVVESVFSGVYLPAIRRYSSAGHVLLRLQNVEHEIFQRLAHYERRRIHRRLLEREARKFRQFEHDTIRETTDVRAISERDAKALSDQTGRPIGVLDAFVDTDRYRPGDAADVETGSIVSIGDYAWAPNRNGVVWFRERIWPQVKERLPDAHWYIVGRNPTPDIRRLAGDGVEVTGRVEDDASFFRRAHLFAVPLHEGSGVRIKILLAMAMGRPVLSTRVGAEGIRYPGLQIENDEDAWVERTVSVLSTAPEIDSAAVDYARKHHHWKRRLELGPDLTG